MRFFTSLNGRSRIVVSILLLWLGLFGSIQLRAQMVTNIDTSIPEPTALETPGAVARQATNYPAPAPAPVPIQPAPATVNVEAPALSPVLSPAPDVAPSLTGNEANWTILAALLTTASLGGFLLYHCGMAQAKNGAHTSVLLLLGVIFALAGYWIGGFALQNGGVGDAHAALAAPLAPAEQGALDHELGFMIGSHHWGLMGSAGFFLASDDLAHNATATLFFAQAAFLALAVAAALGGALERGRLIAMSVTAFLIGAVIYPLFANWVWGGGWLASLGREFNLGHGVVDLAGAGVVHQTAGILAFVIALALGPRQGRFARALPTPLPGHNVPFAVLGAMILLVSWTAANAFAYGGSRGDSSDSTAGVAAVNVILGAAGGALATVFLSAWRKQRNTPARLIRGLLGGAVSVSAGSAFFDSWAALLIGGGAGFLVDRTMILLERRRIDDPAGATAVHGVSGAWGLLAPGFFANGLAGRGLNGVEGPVRGLLYGGAGHQLAAQMLGVAADFAVVFGLGYGCLHLTQKVLGNRVRVGDEEQGLDWPQVGALGYQPDAEPEGTPPSRSEEQS